MPRAISVRAATYLKNRNTPSPPWASHHRRLNIGDVGAPPSWACNVNLPHSPFADIAAVQACTTDVRVEPRALPSIATSNRAFTLIDGQ